MCGILGTINRPFNESVLDVISHRGPDDSGISARKVGRHLLTFGQRRLSILDTSPAGHQPMWTLDGQHGIVFNGEIYNHVNLRAHLPTWQYRGHSDTETILHCLAHHGVRSLDKFNGIFAFSYLDISSNKLFLARDPFGVKPLYYWTDSKSFVFSSELRAIHHFIEDPFELANLAELLRLRYLPAPDTLFKSIFKVRPGHVVEVDLANDSLAVREYAFIGGNVSPTRIKSSSEVVRQYGELVEQAVKSQLLSDVSVGIFLSGGIDSAVVASLAQRHAGYKMQAFTVGFHDKDSADEIYEARQTATLLGLDHHEIRIGFTEFLDLLPRITEIVEEPLATTSVVPMFYVSSLASKHVKVVLSGQGADEALGGYRRYRAELLRRFIPSSLLPMLRKGAQLARTKNSVLLRGLRSVTETGDIRRFETVYSVFATDEIRRLIGSHPNRANERIQYFYDLLECRNLATSVQRMMSIDLRMNLSDDLLLYTDKVTMHHSIECRVPLLDHRLVQFLESLPYQQRVSLWHSKIVHKKFATSILPKCIICRKKKGFSSPTKKWFQANGPVREILLNARSRFASYFDLAEVRRVLDDHAAGINRERQIFLLLSIYYWMETAVRAGLDLPRDLLSIPV